MKKIISYSIIALCLLSAVPVQAQDSDGTVANQTDKDTAISLLEGEYKKFGLGSDDASDRAENQVVAAIDSMKSDQYDVQVAYESVDDQVRSLAKQSDRRKSALGALEDDEFNAKTATERFTEMDPEENLRVVGTIAGSPPYVTPSNAFEASHKEANTAITNVRKILINPDQPGAVPSGDIISDFIPQIIRQLFRFAWVAVFIALTVSGVFFVVAQNNDERITAARGMLYYSLIGFAFIAFAFAIVKAVTDIDFFRFI